MSPFHQIYHIFALRFSDDLCSSPVHLCSVSPPHSDNSSVSPPPNFVTLQLILEWQKSGTGMWSSCLALQSCKRVIMAWLLFCLFKNQTAKVPFWWVLLWQSNQRVREAEELPASQPNCILLFHFKEFIIVNTESMPNPAKIQEHQLCCLLAYRDISLSLATDTLSRKENMFYSVVNILSLGRPQLEICFLLTHFPWASAS